MDTYLIHQIVGDMGIMINKDVSIYTIDIYKKQVKPYCKNIALMLTELLVTNDKQSSDYHMTSYTITFCGVDITLSLMNHGTFVSSNLFSVMYKFSGIITSKKYSFASSHSKKEIEIHIYNMIFVALYDIALYKKCQIDTHIDISISANNICIDMNLIRYILNKYTYDIISNVECETPLISMYMIKLAKLCK